MPKQATPTKTAYQVLGALNHDGADYRPGDTIDLTEEWANALLAVSPPVIQAIATPAPETTENPEKTTDETP